MIINRIVLGIFLLSAGLLSGCSTLWSKHGIPKSQLGNYYSGTSLNIGLWSCMGTKISKDKGFLIFTPITVPIMLIDLPLSIIGDTLYLPIDALITPKNPSLKNDCGQGSE